jgi:hypothetical protein
VGVATTKEPTVSWADIEVSGTRSQRSDGGEKELESEADHNNVKAGYGDNLKAEDVEAMQEGNMHSTGVASEESEEPEQGAVGGSDVRNGVKALALRGDRAWWTQWITERKY